MPVMLLEGAPTALACSRHSVQSLNISGNHQIILTIQISNPNLTLIFIRYDEPSVDLSRSICLWAMKTGMGQDVDPAP